MLVMFNGKNRGGFVNGSYYDVAITYSELDDMIVVTDKNSTNECKHSGIFGLFYNWILL